MSNKWGTDLRYFYCGEYGETTGRPHHHAIYYGLEIPDLKKKRGNNPYFESETIDKIWGMGNVIIAEASPETKRSNTTREIETKRANLAKEGNKSH